MPDILIRGMEMPKNCGGCYLNHGEFCFMLCRKLNIPQEWEARPSNCPLHELPEHGDLIDRSELNNSFESSDFDGEPHDNVYSAICVANSMPAIVPASEEEDANG